MLIYSILALVTLSLATNICGSKWLLIKFYKKDHTLYDTCHHDIEHRAMIFQPTYHVVQNGHNGHNGQRSHQKRKHLSFFEDFLKGYMCAVREAIN